MAVQARTRLCIDQEWDNNAWDKVKLDQPVVKCHQEASNIRVVTVLHPHPTHEECKRLWKEGNAYIKVHLLSSIKICAEDLGSPLHMLLGKEESELHGRAISAVGDQKILTWMREKIQELRQCKCQKCVLVLSGIPNLSDAILLSLHNLA